MEFPNSRSAELETLNILVLCHEYPPVGGGAGVAAAVLVRAYAQEGHSVRVLTMALGDLPAHEEIDGYEIYRLPCGRRQNEMASPFEGLKWARVGWPQIKRLHSESAFDMAHAHFIMPAGILAAALKRAYDVPFLITPHGSDVPGYNQDRLKLVHLLVRPWWRRICRVADMIVCPSQSIRGLLEASVSNVNTSVCRYAFEAERFRPGNKSKHILLCSRLVERKGFQYFLQGIRDLELPGWQLDLVGQGPMYSRIEALARECKIPITMHGWINNDDPLLARLYARAMIFAMPSDAENFPVSLQEGMSAGCAVIACDIAGSAEVVGDTALLVQPRNAIGMRDALMQLAQDPDRCLQMGRRARARVLESFEPADIARRHIELLNSGEQTGVA